MTFAVQELEIGPLHRFQDWPNGQVPKRAAGVYTAWDGERLLYVGMSGRAMTAEDLEVSDGGRVVAKGLWTRLNAHASGRRSGDQFCVYVGDRFVVPELSPSQQLAAGTLSLDSLIRVFVRERLAYRFVVTADGTEAAKLEGAVRRGGLSAGKPYLNPLDRGGSTLPCERKHGRRITSGDVATVPLTLAFRVVACQLLLAGCRAFAACSPPDARLAHHPVTVPRRSCRSLVDSRNEQKELPVGSRRSGWLAWSLWGLAMALEVAAILLWLPNHAALVDRFDSAQDAIPHVFLVPGYATVGAAIATRSRNRIGWLFLAFGVAAALLAFASPYFLRGVVIAPGSLPATAFAASLGGVLWPFSYLFLGLLLLLFPDGRLPSPRWRPAALVYVTSWGLLMFNGLVDPATHTVHGVNHTNPLAIQALNQPTWQAIIQGTGAVAVASLAVMALAPLVRFRRAGQVQRQQLKWFAFVVAGCIASVLTAGVLASVLPAVSGALMVVATAGVLVGLPIAVGLAILRYRLYDIDRLISRTLVYATLTVVLGLCYGGLVLALGQLFGTLGEQTPSWAVAGATLAAAALFGPARRRIQAVVDRRFNRRKYNTAQTIEAFSARLRDEVDLDTLSAELLAVADQTMQPTTASLWLRQPAKPL